MDALSKGDTIAQFTQKWKDATNAVKSAQEWKEYWSTAALGINYNFNNLMDEADRLGQKLKQLSQEHPPVDLSILGAGSAHMPSTWEGSPIEQPGSTIIPAAKSPMSQFGDAMGTNLQSAFEKFDLADSLGGALGEGLLGGHKKGEDVGQQMAKAMQSMGMHLLKDLLQQMITTLIAQTALHISNDWLRTFFEEAAPKPFGFAAGGRPTPGVPSIVGEKGPELFLPDAAGTIIPAGMFQTPGTALAGMFQAPGVGLPDISGLAAAGSSSVGEMHFHAHGMTDPRDFIGEVARQLPAYLKSTGPQFSPASR
jgi:hypothetical protein